MLLHVGHCEAGRTHTPLQVTREPRDLAGPYSRPAPLQSALISHPTRRVRSRRRSPWLVLHRSCGTQPQVLRSGVVHRSECERHLTCRKLRRCRAGQWELCSCIAVQRYRVAPRGTSQTCHPESCPGRSYGVILWLRRGVAPCEVRAAMTARSVCPLLRTELGTCGPVASGTRPGFSRIVRGR